MPGLDFWMRPTVLLSLAVIVLSSSVLVTSIVSLVCKYNQIRSSEGDDV